MTILQEKIVLALIKEVFVAFGQLLCTEKFFILVLKTILFNWIM